MKKFFALIISVVFVMLTCVTASAESVANFNITLVSETDTQAVITIDFDGGTGFSGLDFDMKVDSKKVKVTGAEKGAGFANFEKQAGTAFALININADPIKATALTLNSFRVVDGKDIFKITLKKLTKDKLDSDDVVIDITNCVDSAQQPIKVSLTTDLQGEKNENPMSSSAVAPTDAPDVSSTAPTDMDDPAFTNAISGTSDEVIDVENPIDGEDVSDETADENNGENEKNPKGIIIAVCAVVFVAVVGVATVVIMKKKKSTNEE
ncbi:MAG: hypothetical protein IJC13_00800 [Clostridia bacterium]|nr:hypothetical protein [Clostridia bacterium]